jgi:DNA-binding phage protein
MIFFIAPNPHTVKDRDGYLQRVMAIDELFSNEEKYYYHDFADDQERVLQLIAQSKMIYVHSVYQAHFLKDHYEAFGSKIITDLHGVVPEEEELSGNQEQAAYMAHIEELAVRWSAKLVAVTAAMSRHFNTKYEQFDLKKKWIQLPIFETTLEQKTKDAKAHTGVIYAGGVQSWQNVELMKQAISKKDTYRYVILTPQPAYFEDMLEPALARCLIKSVKSDAVKQYYEKAMMGFVLRDDIVVNRVACPTKLVEYLAFGIVPVVKSPMIGDFKDLGYVYITIEQFMNENISESFLRKSSLANVKVFKKLQQKTKSGKTELTNAYKELKPPTLDTAKAVVKLMGYRVESQSRIQDLQQEVDALKDELHTAQEHYSEVVTSKRWRLITLLLYPLAYTRGIIHRWR